MGEIIKRPITEQENDPLIEILKRTDITLRRGRKCPACEKEILVYDDFLNLTCPGCGYVEGSCFT